MFLHFIETEGSFPCSQKQVTQPDPKPRESIAQSNVLFLYDFS
jgi:hypothetical protein